jgi:hypothetical protein
VGKLLSTDVIPKGPLLRRRVILAAASLFSGVALLSHIVLGFSLPVAVSVMGGIVATACFVTWKRTPPAARDILKRVVIKGAVAGLIATGAYDGSKAILSRLDPSPYNPFEVIFIFGVLLTNAKAAVLAYAAGTAFHLFNGVAFGVSFCMLLGRRGILSGIAWGLALECFQLSLYPGWLGMTFYREFAQFSALGHLVYGAVLGELCRRALRDPRIPEAIGWI